MVLGSLQDGERVAIDVGGDRRVLDRRTERQQTELRIEHHPWRRIENGERRASALAMDVDVSRVGARVGIDVAAHERYRLGANHMIGGERASSSEISQVRSAYEMHHVRAGV